MICTAPPPRLHKNVLILAVLFGLITIAVLATVVPQPHAENKHGQEAIDIRQCLEKNGPYQIWRSLADPNTFYQICQLPDGRWGLQAIIKEGEKRVEKTAFIKGDGSWKALLEYLNRIATPFKGKLP